MGDSFDGCLRERSNAQLVDGSMFGWDAALSMSTNEHGPFPMY